MEYQNKSKEENQMIPMTITDSDMIILNSVESYLQSIIGRAPLNQSPQEKLFITQQAKDYLYSDIVQRFPRVANYILQVDLETNNVAQGLNLALSKHVMDPNFINMLMQFLGKENNAEQNCVSGAYLARLMNKWIEQNVEVPTEKKKVEKDKDKDKEKTEASAPTATTTKDPLEPIRHIQWAVDQLLGNIQALVHARYTNLQESQIRAIAACIAMNNDDTVCQLIDSDLPITADILDIVENPEVFIRSALLLEKTEVPGKPTANQQAFMDSLVRWVYRKLNSQPTQFTYTKMAGFYGVVPAKVETKFINPRDCGNQYPNLKMVADQIINNK